MTLSQRAQHREQEERLRAYVNAQNLYGNEAKDCRPSTQQRDIPRRFDQLATSVSRTRERVQILAQRLSPVLASSAPEGATGKPPEPIPITQVGNSLSELDQSVNVIDEVLSDLLDRLEL